METLFREMETGGWGASLLCRPREVLASSPSWVCPFYLSVSRDRGLRALKPPRFFL